MTVSRLQPARQPREEALDRIFVRDMVFDAFIGVHHVEQGNTQRVRVSVDVDIPTAPRNDRIANTLSYDYITGGIRAILDDGHINLVETLAERIAGHVLAHPLARRVRVRVEKLDRVPGAMLGVEIAREKS